MIGKINNPTLGLVAAAGKTSVAPAPTNGTPDVVTLGAKPQTLGGAIIKGAESGGFEVGNAFGQVVGGATRFVTMGAGALVGVAGGIAALGIVGAAAGVPTAMLFGHGGLSVLTTAFATSGVFAQIGSLVGPACGAAAGWYLGGKIGYYAGFPVPAAAGAIVGGINGASKHFEGRVVEGPQIDHSDSTRTKSGLERTASKIMTAVGLAAGATGGFAIGGVAASGATAVSGLLSHSAALSTILSSGMTGALVGAGVGAVFLGIGGYQIVKMIGDRVHQAALAGASFKESKEIDMKSAEIDRRMAGLQADLQTATTTRSRSEQLIAGKMAEVEQTKAAEDRDSQQRIAAQGKRKTDMDATVKARNADMDHQQAQVDAKNHNIPGIAQQRADQRLADLQKADEAAYQTRKGKDDTWEGSLNTRQAAYDERNRDMAQIVDQQSNQRRDQSAAELEAKYQTRKGGLDQRQASLQTAQGQLDARKANLPTLVHQEGDRLLGIKENELKQNLGHVEDGLKHDLDAHQAQLDQAVSAQADSYRGDLSNIESGLRAQYSQAESAVTQLSAQVTQLQTGMQQLQAGISQSQANAQSERQQAVSITNGIGAEQQQLQSETAQARGDAEQAQSQLAADQSRLQQAQSAEQTAQAAYDQSAQQMNQLQADISTLNNELANKV